MRCLDAMRCDAGLWERRVDLIFSGCSSLYRDAMATRIRVDHRVAEAEFGFWFQGWVWSKMLPLAPKRTRVEVTSGRPLGLVMGWVCLSFRFLIPHFVTSSLPHFSLHGESSNRGRTNIDIDILDTHCAGPDTRARVDTSSSRYIHTIHIRRHGMSRSTP
jgi:hypothetical protein